MMTSMQVLMLEPPPGFLEERARLGHDSRDEVWDGVLHMAPQPTTTHQGFGTDLIPILLQLARPRGWRVFYELSVFEPSKGEKNYRVPDLIVADPQYLSKRGVEGRAELVIETLSPNDESRKKFGFYAARQVQEIWIVDPDARTVEVYVLRGDTYFTIAPDRDGTVRAPVLGLELSTIAGPMLHLAWRDGSADV
jgi:Uma2 family endonuclease